MARLGARSRRACHFGIADVPQDEGGDEQLESECAIGLVLEPPIAQFAELVEGRAGKRIAGFALVEARLGGSTQIDVAQPIEHENRAFEAARSRSARASPFSRIGGQATQHRRSGDRAGADRCGEPQQFVPMRGDMSQGDRFGPPRKIFTRSSNLSQRT